MAPPGRQTVQNDTTVGRFRQLLTLILEKSRGDAVSWQPTGSVGYTANFPGEEIQVRYVTPASDNDYYRAALCRGRDELLSVSATENDADWGLLASLYAEAERIATGWDKAMAEIEEALKSGWRPTSVPARATSPHEISKVDIPF